MGGHGQFHRVLLLEFEFDDFGLVIDQRRFGRRWRIEPAAACQAQRERSRELGFFVVYWLCKNVAAQLHRGRCLAATGENAGDAFTAWRQRALPVERQGGVELAIALELAREVVSQALALAPGRGVGIDVVGKIIEDFAECLAVFGIAQSKQQFELVDQPVLADLELASIRPVSRIDTVGFELVQAQVAQHEVGHRLVQVAEKKHLAEFVLVLLQNLQQKILLSQLPAEIGLVFVDQQVVEFCATQAAQLGGSAERVEQFRPGVERQ